MIFIKVVLATLCLILIGVSILVVVTQITIGKYGDKKQKRKNLLIHKMQRRFFP